MDEPVNLEYNVQSLVQFIPKFEEYNILDIKDYDPKAFRHFELEIKQDVMKAVHEMDTKHIEFSGHLQKGKKEGKGGFKCKKTGNFFYGSWQNDVMNGYGILFFGENCTHEFVLESAGLNSKP